LVVIMKFVFSLEYIIISMVLGVEACVIVHLKVKLIGMEPVLNPEKFRYKIKN